MCSEIAHWYFQTLKLTSHAANGVYLQNKLLKAVLYLFLEVTPDGTERTSINEVVKDIMSVKMHHNTSLRFLLLLAK